MTIKKKSETKSEAKTETKTETKIKPQASDFQAPIRRLKIHNFRNIKNLDFVPGEKLNIIYGDNAKGKTNLIESIWMLTGERSFRKARDSDLIMFEEKKAEINVDFFANKRIQNSKIRWSPQKTIYLNNCKVESLSDYLGVFSAIVFSPEDLNLVKSGPDRRRHFLNVAISQIKPRYSKLLIEYNKILTQRSALLKDIKYHPALVNTLDIWDDILSKISANITKFRSRYISKLVPIAQEIYSGISNSKEKLEIKYSSSVSSDLKNLKKNLKSENNNFFLDMSFEDLSKAFLKKIVRSRDLDVKLGFSQVGPHRDDFDIKIDGFSVKNFGSQGQQRSAVLTLKLAEAQILKKLVNKNPVILLDDVMSELDSYRKKYIFNFLKDSQAFITCCDKNYFDKNYLSKSCCDKSCCNDESSIFSQDFSVFKIDDLI